MIHAGVNEFVAAECKARLRRSAGSRQNILPMHLSGDYAREVFLSRIVRHEAKKSPPIKLEGRASVCDGVVA